MVLDYMSANPLDSLLSDLLNETLSISAHKNMSIKDVYAPVLEEIIHHMETDWRRLGKARGIRSYVAWKLNNDKPWEKDRYPWLTVTKVLRKHCNISNWKHYTGYRHYPVPAPDYWGLFYDGMWELTDLSWEHKMACDCYSFCDQQEMWDINHTSYARYRLSLCKHMLANIKGE